MSRPPTVVPRGRVTLAQAAELSGLSYQRIYSLVTAGEVPSMRDSAGVYTIATRDARQIKRREPAAGDPRKAVMVRVPHARYEVWERAAKDLPVSTWLGVLADKASGAAR